MKKLVILALMISISNVQAKVDVEACNRGQILKCNPVATNILLFGLSTYMPEQMTAAILFAYAAYGLPHHLDLTVNLTSKNDQQKKVVRELVNNDVNDYYTSGELSAELVNAVELVKQSDSELSDFEALDLIVKSVNQ